MAEKETKETLSYKRERESFLNELQRFHHNRRTPYQVKPSIRGKDVDLYELYSKVTAAGGWEKINEEGRWEEFAPLFNLPEGCTNADQALKRIYIRYLDIYERIHHRGEDPDKQDEYPEGEGGAGSGLTPGARHKRNKNPLGGVALKYNYQQHKVPVHIRHNYGLSTHLSCPSAYSKLEQSLLSGLPNEVDFAFNICTLLSSEGKRTLQLEEAPLILNLMLSHVAICRPGDGLLELHLEGWKPMSTRNFFRFWYETVEDPEMRTLILSKSLETEKDESNDSPPNSILAGLFSPDDNPYNGVLNVGRELGLRDKEGQRALQLAIILRNLSFEKGNMFVLSNSDVVFRFLLLCMHSNYGNLRQLALDTLSNMALQMVLEPMTKIKTRLLMREISRAISSPDKYDVIGGLDLLARLCQVEENEELLSEGLDEEVYSNIVHYLTVHDIQLIVYTLECLYQLSELGEVAGTHIASVKHAVATLVSLVTIEAQSYGPESLRGIKVVEHVSVEAGQPVPVPSMSSLAPAPTPQPPARLEHPQPIPQQQRPSVPPQQQPVAVSTPPIPTAVAAARTNSESENTAACVAWLGAHYEVSHANFVMPRLQLYKDYTLACNTTHSHTMQAVANAVSFANCVRTAFPTLELVKVDKTDGATDFQYRGLRKRPQPKQYAQQESGRPVNAATPSPPPPVQQQRSSRPGGGESTLIKSLLASKLQQNMQRIHPPPSPQASSSIVSQPPRVSQLPILSQALQQPVQHHQQQQGGLLHQQLSGQHPQQQLYIPQHQEQQTSSVSQPTPHQQQQQQQQHPVLASAAPVLPYSSSPLSSSNTPPTQQHSNTAPHHSLQDNGTTKAPETNCVSSSNAYQVTTTTAHSTQPNAITSQPASSIPLVVNGPHMGNGVSSPGSSKPPTPLSLNPDEEAMDLKEEDEEEEEDKANDSIEEKKAQIKKLMQDTNAIRDRYLTNNSNGLVCHNSNGSNNKEQGQNTQTMQKNGKGCGDGAVVENGVPSPASTPPVNGLNGSGQQTTSQADQPSNIVISENTSSSVPVTVNKIATPPTPNPTPELPTVASLPPSVTSDDAAESKESTEHQTLPMQCDGTVDEDDVAQQRQQQDQAPTTQEQQGVGSQPPQPAPQMQIEPQQQFQQVPIPHQVLQHQQSAESSPLPPQPVLQDQPQVSQQIPLEPQQMAHQPQVSQQQTMPQQQMAHQPQVSQQQTMAPQQIAHQPQVSQQQMAHQPQVSQQQAMAPQQIAHQPQVSQQQAMAPQQIAHQPQVSQQQAMAPQQITHQQYLPNPQTSQPQQILVQQQQYPLHQQQQMQQQHQPMVSQHMPVMQQQQFTQQQIPVSQHQQQQTSLPAGHQIIGGAQHVVIQQGGQQHVVQLGQPLGQQMAAKQHVIQHQQQPQQHQQVIHQQQSLPVSSQGSFVQQQQQPTQFVGGSTLVQGGTLQQRPLIPPQQQSLPPQPQALPPQPQALPPQPQALPPQPQALPPQPQALPPQPQALPPQQQALPPQQVLQVEVPYGQQMMQVRMPPSNGQAQILHVHVPQGPGQPPHVMLVSIPPAPNGQAQTVQVQVKNPTPFPPPPPQHAAPQQRGTAPPAPAQQQHQHQQQQPVSQQQQQQPQQQSGSGAPSPSLPNTGQQHPILQQHLQHPTPPVSPSTRKRAASPTSSQQQQQQQPANKRKRPSGPPVPQQIGQKRTDSVDSNQSAASSSQSLPSPALPSTSNLTTLNYMCEYRDCSKPSFENQKECHKHVLSEHFDKSKTAFRCMWEGCDGIVRGKWSYVQHLQDRHLSEQALKAAALRRLQQQHAPPPPPPTSTAGAAGAGLAHPPAPVYPNDAALQAIRRFAIKPPYQQFVEAKEGPVTKHIRLTSALILRNLARYSALGRSLIKQHEQHLAYVAFSSVEASNALSHCLSELQKH